METCLLILCLAMAPADTLQAPRAALLEAPRPVLAIQPERRAPDRLFGEDKLRHFLTSFVVTSLSASGARVAGLDHDTSLMVGAGVGTSVGIAKELHDVRREGETASFLDLLWDVAGVGAATIVVAQSN